MKPIQLIMLTGAFCALISSCTKSGKTEVVNPVDKPQPADSTPDTKHTTRDTLNRMAGKRLYDGKAELYYLDSVRYDYGVEFNIIIDNDSSISFTGKGIGYTLYRFRVPNDSNYFTFVTDDKKVEIAVVRFYHNTDSITFQNSSGGAYGVYKRSNYWSK